MAFAVLAWAVATVMLGRMALDALHAARVGPTDLDTVLGGLAAVLGLALLGWTALAAGSAALAAALPAGTAAARRAGAMSERITPPALRRLLVLAVGAALASSSVPAQAATGDAGATGKGAHVVATALVTGPLHGGRVAGDAGGLDPGWGSAARTGAPSPPAPGPAPAPRAAAAHDRSLPALDPAWAPGTGRRLRSVGELDTGAVVVRRGDTLWDLAARDLGPSATDAEIAHAWPQWYRANRAVIGRDPDVLRPGQRLVPPGRPTGGAA